MRPERRNRLKLVPASIFALMLYQGIGATGARAAVMQDDFLVARTGNLVNLCKATPSDALYTAAINFCHGFSVGVYRVLEEENRARPRHMFCAPVKPPSRAEAIAAFVSWVDAHPDEKNLAPADGIAAYLQQQFPCGRGR
jgi:hypothetical protein